MSKRSRLILPATLAVLLLESGWANEVRGAGRELVRVRASEALAPCLAPALTAFTLATGIAAELEVADPDPPGNADVVVGDDAELTRLLEGGGIDHTTTFDLGYVPWVLVVPDRESASDVAALAGADRVVVLGGRLGIEARTTFRGLPEGRLRISRDRDELRQAPYALVPRTLAGAGEHRPTGIRPLVVSASALSNAPHKAAARKLLSYLKGDGHPACFLDASAAGVRAHAVSGAAPYATAVVDWWLPECTLRSNLYNDPQQALGAPNAQQFGNDLYDGMISLGQGGYVTVDMGGVAVDGPGADVRVYQTTSVEPVSVYASANPQGPFTLVGFRQQCGVRSPGFLSNHCDFDLFDGRLAEARYFKVEDGEIYPCLAAGSRSEGADIDAVQILNPRP